jgi:TonB family protein
MLAASGIALVALVILSLLGPSSDEIDRWFRHTGIRGELQILDNIDIVPDVDPTTQERKEPLAGATEGVQVEADRPRPHPEVDNPTPQPHERGLPSPKVVDADRPELRIGSDEIHQVEMHRGTQQSLDFILRKFVRPDYPEDATTVQRARVIWVVVAMYVDELGHVVEAYTTRNDGGPPFERAVLKAVKQWEYEPLLVNGEPHGFWDEIRWEFTVKPDGVDTRVRG